MSISDQALSILAFAAYHELESGDAVSEVILEDGQGHKASAEGVRELEQAGMIEVNGTRGKFTAQGMTRLRSVVEAIRANRG
jgi:coproporphyrinogen III oxidase-like Fe-S oxidoreductase